MGSENKQYAERDAYELDKSGGYYGRHVMAMTSEKLHAKSDIAAELGHRDMVIDQLRAEVERREKQRVVLCDDKDRLIDMCQERDRKIGALSAEVEAMRKDAEKFRFVERAMEALGCDEREGGIVTAASLVLISSAHKLNAARGVIEQEGVTFDDDSIGDWRVTIERIGAAMAAKDGQP